MTRFITLCLSAFLLLSQTSFATAITHQQARAQHAAKSDTTPVDLNHADASELSTLQGIGPKKAKDIIDYRQKQGPFSQPSDLTKVKGIGQKTFKRLLAKNPGRITVNIDKNIR